MALLIKGSRSEFQEQDAVHALIIGVSKYRHIDGGDDLTDKGKEFELGQLSSAAKSASDFAKWLWEEFRHPSLSLASISLLLSPSHVSEIDEEVKGLIADGTDYAATEDNVKKAVNEFRTNCGYSKNNVAIVYVAGHGVQITKHGAILLLEDFASEDGTNSLSGSLNIGSLHGHMNNEYTAEKQFWFVDTCRQEPVIANRFENMRGYLDYEQFKKGAVISPLYLASTPGNQAYGKINEVSLFRKALKWALEDQGAMVSPDDRSDKWHVSASSLGERLKEKIDEYSTIYSLNQEMEIAGLMGYSIFHEYQSIPTADLVVSVIPKMAESEVTWTVSDDSSKPISNYTDRSDWPGKATLEVGVYLLTGSANAENKYFQAVSLNPPRLEVKMEVTV